MQITVKQSLELVGGGIVEQLRQIRNYIDRKSLKNACKMASENKCSIAAKSIIVIRTKICNEKLRALSWPLVGCG